jgi:hypothetical protein
MIIQVDLRAMDGGSELKRAMIEFTVFTSWKEILPEPLAGLQAPDQVPRSTML